jgi:acyl-coenzyme A thioesterase PaaI-like protein
MEQRAFQDELGQIGLAHCWGCGSANEHGLHIKSYWDNDGSGDAVCTWQPQPYHVAVPGIVSGGIIATLIDCHCAATAVASAYRAEGRPISAGHPLVYVTSSLRVSYLRPTPSAGPVTLRARVAEVAERKTTLTCSLYAATGEECARGEVVAARAPATWKA